MDKQIRHLELLKLKRDRNLIKDNVYVTDRGIYIALSNSSFRLYNRVSGFPVIISATEPIDPEPGTIWIDISE